MDKLHQLTPRQAQIYFYYHVKKMTHEAVMQRVHFQGGAYYAEWKKIQKILGNLDAYVDQIKEEDLKDWKQEQPEVSTEKPSEIVKRTNRPSPLIWIGLGFGVVISIFILVFIFARNSPLRAVSSTPLPPTRTLVPTQPVLWEHDFSNGMPKDWRVITTEVKPSIVDDNFIADKTFMFAIGDDSWKNYSVRVNYLSDALCHDYQYVGVRATSVTDMMEARLDCLGGVSLFDGNMIPGSQEKRIGPFEMKVVGDTYSYYGNDIYHEGHPTGFVVINISGGVKVSDIKVTQLP